MIYGIGSDIVDVRRIQKSLDQHGRRFAERILVAAELEEYDENSSQAHYLAKRFAAKEATAKALGSGFRHGLSMKHICVTRDELGKPGLSFDAVAKEKTQQAGILSAHLTLSDEHHYAIAFVVLEMA
ncbi:MAG: holo-ACP synthase [Gammaproteobacteria bacterium]|nr:holo-ACP synthase [Gammaproteobacteria bacterium]